MTTLTRYDGLSVLTHRAGPTFEDTILSYIDGETGFDPGPDSEEEVPWDCDDGLPFDGPDLGEADDE